MHGRTGRVERGWCLLRCSSQLAAPPSTRLFA